MAKLLFPLRGVPDDEAQAVRELLGDHEIDTSETNAGMLGIGTAAIWVSDVEDYNQAKQLLTAYQQQRYQDARQEYELDKEAGRERTSLDLLKQNPVRFLGYVLVISFLVYLVLMPFFAL